MVTAMAPAGAALSPEDEASIKQVRQETRELLQTLESYGAAQRDEAIQEIEIAIIRLDNRIERLQSRVDNGWDDMTAQARKQARESLAALQQQRIVLAEWYGQLKGSSADAWSEIRRGFSEAYSDINKAWENAIDEFGAGNG
jgi:hypothetical protein